MMAQRRGVGGQLLTRNGNDWTDRYPSVAGAIYALKVKSCLIDGEITVCDGRGLAVFDLLRHGSQIKTEAVLFAFDLLELDGEDLRPMPIEARKHKLAQLVRNVGSGLHLCEHLHGEGMKIFEHACKLGCEGIVSKRVGSRYVSGRADNWIKIKNPAAPAVKREAGRLGQKTMASTMEGKNRIMIFGPKGDGTYVVEFRTAAGEALAISIPRTEAAVIRYFQERMP
jgi:bifunctional non-homologous end joining protein LigD